jgi:hypothetical protein
MNQAMTWAQPGSSSIGKKAPPNQNIGLTIRLKK